MEGSPAEAEAESLEENLEAVAESLEENLDAVAESLEENFEAAAESLEGSVPVAEDPITCNETATQICIEKKQPSGSLHFC